MVESEFSFFEVNIKRMFCNPVELSQASFGIAPEAFNAVDVRAAVGEFVVAMVDTKVLGIAHIDEPIVAGPAVGMDDAEAEFEINRVDSAETDAGQLGRIGSHEVHRKSVDDSSKNLLTDSGTEIITVTDCRHRN